MREPISAVPREEPGSPPVVTTADLGRELKRWMRHGPGGPVKVATLAHRVGVSTSTLYAYLSGTTLPPSVTLDDVLITLRVPPAERRRLLTARDALPAARRPDGGARLVPQELPPAPTGFVGRGPVLDALDDAAGAAERGRGPGVVVVVGPAGVGKSALVLHWAHRHDDDFPDGRLYVDLRGFSPGEPRATASVAAALLRSLGLDPDLVPDEVDERVARLRSLLATQRVLLVLDNALDADQVRPLLPGSGRALVLVTSRHRLDALAVRPGAAHHSLDPMDADVAADLLRSRTASCDLPDDACESLTRRCGGLPLALRIVAARLAGTGGVAQVLRDLSHLGLDEFDLGDPQTSVRAVFSWSESRLEPDEAESFVLLGLSPIAEVDPLLAGALWGLDGRAARRMLDSLARVHLVQPRAEGRFGLHDLLGEYARERAAEQVAPDERSRRMRRLVEKVLEEVEDAGVSDISQTTQTHTRIVGRWGDLVGVVGVCAAQEWHDLTLRLVGAMRPHFDVGGRFLDDLRVTGHALRAARAVKDPVEESRLLRSLGATHMRLGHHDEALAHLEAGLVLDRRFGEPTAVAGGLNNLGNLYERLGLLDRAVATYTEGLALVRVAGFGPGEATLLLNLGCVAIRRGDLDEALACDTRALEIFQEHDDAPGTARAWGNLGGVHVRAGRGTAALSALDEALRQAREIGASSIEAEVLNTRGEALLAQGDLDGARSAHRESLRLATELADPFEQAQAHVGLGHVAAAAGDRGAARASWRIAREIFERLHLPDVDRVTALLA